MVVCTTATDDCTTANQANFSPTTKSSSSSTWEYVVDDEEGVEVGWGGNCCSLWRGWRRRRRRKSGCPFGLGLRRLSPRRGGSCSQHVFAADCIEEDEARGEEGTHKRTEEDSNYRVPNPIQQRIQQVVQQQQPGPVRCNTGSRQESAIRRCGGRGRERGGHGPSVWLEQK